MPACSNLTLFVPKIVCFIIYYRLYMCTFLLYTSCCQTFIIRPKNEMFVCPFGPNIGRVGSSGSVGQSFFFFFLFLKIRMQKKCNTIHVCASGVERGLHSIWLKNLFGTLIKKF